jgi:hypothetical protein
MGKIEIFVHGRQLAGLSEGEPHILARVAVYESNPKGGAHCDLLFPTAGVTAL